MSDADVDSLKKSIPGKLETGSHFNARPNSYLWSCPSFLHSMPLPCPIRISY